MYNTDAGDVGRYNSLIMGFLEYMPTEGADVSIADIQVCGTLPSSGITTSTMYIRECNVTAR